ncbi:pimeloyl-ACP methyl ester carboxylesterase [Pseudonocardia hierapolitana]|uniref:Pimeloyl-ACP methyl ester carboxylesterase n=1 Tax=Pseudonocardia hierapolitana TaxID=1128676 RepID=A0A561SN68_9PSEU|nr:alpha/beta hydrolase [Pseudonocardia hierapolitana]TWF76307.1 pimeloyl-ACP methyl ester carboxylesterase [Pseudonocardia hierapolitana]
MTTARSVPAADGVPLHVALDGPQDAPVTVVLVHGWTLDRRVWRPVTRSLATGPSPVRVVRPDHRGHGRSAPVDPATMTIDQLADDLAEVVAATAPAGPLVLAGHSMGGMTLMALAERHPDVMARAVGVALVATASGGLAERPFGLSPPAAAVYRRVQRRIAATRGWSRREHLGDPRLIAPATRWLLLGARPSPEAIRITCETVGGCRPLTVSGFQPTLEAHERDAALAAFADIPTVVLVGSRDRLTPVRAARRIADAVPSASLTIFPEAGHMLPLERVSGVASRIAALATGAVRTGELRSTA